MEIFLILLVLLTALFVVKKEGQVEALNYNEMLADAYAAIAELTNRLKDLEDLKDWPVGSGFPLNRATL
jgi:hypothetical protein